ALSAPLHRAALFQCADQHVQDVTDRNARLSAARLSARLCDGATKRCGGDHLIVIVGMSFWTGFVVRTYAWLVILRNRGPIAAAFPSAGWGRPPQLLFPSFSSPLGMTHVLLPYMVLALYGVMRKIDPSYMRAAEGLGARPFGAFRHVFLPLS